MSTDGKWLLYQTETPSSPQQTRQETEIWLIEVETGVKKNFFKTGIPLPGNRKKNVVAFNAGGILNISDIAGGGRIVFGFKNKDLKIREMPVYGTYTPEELAELDFD